MFPVFPGYRAYTRVCGGILRFVLERFNPKSGQRVMSSRNGLGLCKRIDAVMQQVQSKQFSPQTWDETVHVQLTFYLLCSCVKHGRTPKQLVACALRFGFEEAREVQLLKFEPTTDNQSTWQPAAGRSRGRCRLFQLRGLPVGGRQERKMREYDA